MPKYTVTANTHLHVKTDEQDRIVERHRFKRGETVEMSEGEAERLVRTGGLRRADEEESDSNDEGPSETPEEQDGTGAGAEDDEFEEEPEEDEPEDDEFEDMSYPDLQQAAKARDLNAGGSADDLKARIREYEDSQKSSGE